MSNEQKKYRHWFIETHDEVKDTKLKNRLWPQVYDSLLPGTIHVIDYSALTDLQAKYDEAVKLIEKLDSILLKISEEPNTMPLRKAERLAEDVNAWLMARNAMYIIEHWRKSRGENE